MRTASSAKRICRSTLFLLTFFCSSSFSQSNLKLWYKEPAKKWTDALPLGNGRIGAMVFGKVSNEVISMNDGTLWSGGPANLNPNPGAPKYLSQVREALFNGDYALGEELCKKLQGLYTQSYLPLGDIFIHQPVSDSTNYRRELSVSNALAKTIFTAHGITYSREMFVSAPDNVMVIRFLSSSPGHLNFTIGANSQLHFTNKTIGNSELVMSGKAAAHADPHYVNDKGEAIIYNDTANCRGMRFQLRLKAKTKDGKVEAGVTGLQVTNATEVIVYVTTATSFNGFDKCPDSEGKNEDSIAHAQLAKAYAKSYSQLKQVHVADYTKFFNRVTIALNGNPVVEGSTFERLMKYADGGADPSLEALYFQYGRYLLISCSRPGGAPANLQGIWNPLMQPPWSSNYTTNINTQMNYWPAETLNLSEMHRPLLNFIKNLEATGRQTAKNFYNAGGWAVHHNADIWATSNPVGNLGNGSPSWANWSMGSPWLSRHLWEHYSFSGDKTFLQNTAYPLMKGAAQFCLDWLVEHNGYLVTAPASSPENIFITEEGKKGSISVASTMDMSIIWDLFTNVIEASEVLQTDPDFKKLLIEKRSRLFPLHVGKKGNLQEWFKDWEDAEPHHRHVSHLFGLYPGRQIAPVTTPVFATAARKTLNLRGDDGTGWSIAWKINFWARLYDGDHAYKLLRALLHLTGVEGTNYALGGGSYANLFCAHPPFQIDGNFGGIAGMGEMFVQSHEDFIHLLPALPLTWQEGKVTGLRARGGFTVDLQWKKHKLTAVTLRSQFNTPVVLRYGNKVVHLMAKPGQVINLRGDLTAAK